MSRLNEKHVAVARVYSRSMLDLAEADGSAEGLLEELQALRGLLADQPAFAGYLESPVVEADDRRATIERVLRGRASDLLVDALQVLNRNGRLAILSTVIETYRIELLRRHRRVDVEVTTAVPLAADQRAALHALAERLTGQRPELIEAVDEGLLGGLVLRIGDRKIDTSVAKDLKTIRAQLAERASREILKGRLAAGQR